jgi:hypothetical protein
MDGMPRPRPPHLHRQITRHGKTVWYVRVGKGRRTRIRAAFGTPEFDAEYHAAVTARPRPSSNTPAGTLKWLIDRYRETPAWLDLSLSTRQQREAILAHIITSAGNQSYAQITRATIVAGRDRRHAKPAQARHFLETMRGLFRWATDAQLVQTNPTAGVADPARPKNAGIPVWTEEEVAAYEQRWALGTRQRVWLDVAVHGAAPRRCSEARTAARSQWRCDDQDREDRHRSDTAGSSGARGDIACRPLRRSYFHRRREWPSARQAILRQSVSQGVSCSWR